MKWPTNWLICCLLLFAAVLIGVPLWKDVENGNDLSGYVSQGTFLLFLLGGWMAGTGMRRIRDQRAKLSVVRNDPSQGG